MEFKKVFLALFFLFICLNVAAPITNLKIPNAVRLNETLTITGDFGTSDTLCSFFIFDSNGFVAERLSDEFTNAAGKFYAQRAMTEPPYFRGDDFNVVVTCGTDQADDNFAVTQPLSLAHNVQQGWNFWTARPNLDSLAIFGSILLIPALLLTGIIFMKKRSEGK